MSLHSGIMMDFLADEAGGRGEVLKEGKTLCLFYDNPDAGNNL